METKQSYAEMVQKKRS